MARRHHSNRRRSRGSFRFLYKLLSVLLICAAIVAALTLFFRVEKIEVSGAERYSAEEILSAAGVAQGDNLFLLNKYTVAANITQQWPYVEEVRINRRMPDTLLIDVKECEAVVQILQGEEHWLISAKGKILEQVIASGLPAVDGCVLVEPVVGAQIQMEDVSDQTELMALLEVLHEEALMGPVKAIHLDDADSVIMEYTARFTADMPRGADYDQMLYNLNSCIAKLESNEKGTFDMHEEEKIIFIPKK